MPPGAPPSDADERLRFVGDPDALAELDLTVADLGDPDMRSLVIRHEHPELERALREGRRDVEVEGESINPRLHLAMHEIVATQLWDDEPPEAWETAARLLELGHDRHEILHMLAAPVAQQVWGTLHEERPYDRDLHVAAGSAPRLLGAGTHDQNGRAASRRRAQGRSPRCSGRPARQSPSQVAFAAGTPSPRLGSAVRRYCGELIEMLRLVRSQHGRRGSPWRPAFAQGLRA